MRNAISIPGYENYYASPEGEIYHQDRKLNPIHSKLGKSDRVKLKLNGKVVAIAVPKLVALAHVPNPEKLSNIILIDRDTTNYNVNNIRWVSLADSIRYNQKRIDLENLIKESYNAEYISDQSSAIFIPGYSKYKASTKGKVFLGNRLLNVRAGNGNRAVRITIRNDHGEAIRITVAKLVAITFIPNPNEYDHIVFEDRDKRNCDVSNLRWVSKSEYGRFVHGCYDLDTMLSLPIDSKKEPDWIDPERVPVKNYEGYFITQNGVFYHNNRIISPSRRKGRSLKVRAKLMYGAYRYFGLATLVAEHFLPNPNKYKHIIFKDRNNHNCNVENIAWVDSETFIYYCGIIQGMKKRVFTPEEALTKATDVYLRKYYKTLDESWIMECWSNIETRITMHDWNECRSECYLYFMDRARRFSILKDPLGLVLFYSKGVRSRLRKEVSAYMPYKKIVQNDESLRDMDAMVEKKYAMF